VSELRTDPDTTQAWVRFRTPVQGRARGFESVHRYGSFARPSAAGASVAGTNRRRSAQYVDVVLGFGRRDARRSGNSTRPPRAGDRGQDLARWTRAGAAGGVGLAQRESCATARSSPSLALDQPSPYEQLKRSHMIALESRVAGTYSIPTRLATTRIPREQTKR
jgi:hypothetical protein